MKNVFLETANVTRFRSAVNDVSDIVKGQPGLALVWGQAGRGKSKAALEYHANSLSDGVGTVYLSVWEDWTQSAFLQAICFEVCGQRPHGSNKCKRLIVDALERDPRTILIDEADRLHIKRIEDLRDIHEATGCAVVLIGEEELLGLLGGRRRIWSRVTQEVQFAPISVSDIVLYGAEAADLEIDTTTANLIQQKTDGDFRLVHVMVKMLEQVARARQTDEVTVAMVEDVLRTRSWRRG